MRASRSAEGTLRTLVILLLLLLHAFAGGPRSLVSAQGSGPEVEASVDQTRISTDQVLTLRIQVRGASDVSRPDVEGIAGFQVVGSSSASQFSIGSGGIESMTVLTYQLEPTQVGQLTIGPLELRADGRVLQTLPLTVTVVAGRRPTSPPAGSGSAPGAAGPLPGQVPADQSGPYTLEAEAWPLEPYQGEQVAYTLRVRQWAETGVRARYQAPDFGGFWNASPEPERRQSIQDQGGRPARVTEFRSLLFPTRTGPLSITPASLDVPASFWGAGFSLESPAVDLTVRPLPEGAPPGFAGAVGRFSLAAQPEAGEVTAGEPLRLEVTVAGEGLIETLPEPVWPELPAGWRWIEGRSGAQQEAKDGRVTGSRSFERFVVPDGEGAAEIPAIVYPYFDPEQERYQEARTAPIAIQVRARTDGATPGAAGAGAAARVEPATARDPDAPGKLPAARADLGLGAISSSLPLAKAAAELQAAGRSAEAAAALDTLLATERGLDRRRRARLLLALCEAHTAGDAPDWGRARLAWEQAGRLDPAAARADDIPCAQLLEALPPSARGEAADLAGFLAAGRRWIRDGSLLALGLLLALGTLALALGARRRPLLADAAFVTAFAAALALGLYGPRRAEDAWRPRAILLSDGARLADAPGPAAETRSLATLPAGSPLQVLDRQAGYLEVAVLGQGLRGWLPEGSAAPVVERER